MKTIELKRGSLEKDPNTEWENDPNKWLKILALQLSLVGFLWVTMWLIDYKERTGDSTYENIFLTVCAIVLVAVFPTMLRFYREGKANALSDVKIKLEAKDGRSLMELVPNSINDIWPGGYTLSVDQDMPSTGALEFEVKRKDMGVIDDIYHAISDAGISMTSEVKLQIMGKKQIVS